MNESPTNPERPRPSRISRRTVAVVCFLLMAAFAGWWLWPQPIPKVDPRFFGSWQFAPDNEVHDLYGLKITLSASGDGVLWNASLPKSKADLKWSVEDGILTIHSIQGRLTGVSQLFNRLPRQIFGPSTPPIAHRYRIVDVNPKWISLKKSPTEKGPNETTLVRLPD